MIVFSTSTYFCQGDDFIRDGVRALLPEGLLAGGELWAPRTSCEFKGERQPLWRCARTVPSIKECLKGARAFVMAGTPAWMGGSLNEWWEACIETKTPIWLIGVGRRMRADEELLARAKPLIKVATTRDANAGKMLAAAGIPFQRFLEPGFHAPYWKPKPKRFRMVMCYRHKQHGGEPEQAERQAAYQMLFRKFRGRINRIVVHQADEIEIARKLFGCRVFFSHEPRRYAEIYCQTQCYVGGRLHGAVPVLACGGEAHLLYHADKTEALSAHADWLPVRVHEHADWDKIEPGLKCDKPAVRKAIEADKRAHAGYLRRALCG